MEGSLSIQNLHQSLQSELNQLDEERLQARAALRKVNLIWAPVFVLVLVVVIWFTGNIFFIIFAFVIVSVPWLIQRNKIIKAFARSICSMKKDGAMWMRSRGS